MANDRPRLGELHHSDVAGQLPSLVRNAGRARPRLRRVKRATGADLTASSAGKIAGSLNFKDKYAPDFPRITIRHAQPGRLTSPAKRERLGLVASVERFAPLSPAQSFSLGTEKWPSYAMCLDEMPRNRDGSESDRSRADYVGCMIAISWGHGIDDTAARLLQESCKAREDGKGYAV